MSIRTEYITALLIKAKSHTSIQNGNAQIHGSLDNVTAIVDVILNNNTELIDEFEKHGYSNIFLENYVVWKIIPFLDESKGTFIKQFNDSLKN